MIVYLARDIPAFVMYCVNGESGSSLLIESTDYDIYDIYIISKKPLLGKIVLKTSNRRSFSSKGRYFHSENSVR